MQIIFGIKLCLTPMTFPSIGSSITDIRDEGRVSWDGNHLQPTLCREMPDLTLGRLIHTSKSLVQWNLNAEVSLVHSAKDSLTSTVVEDFFHQEMGNTSV